MKKLSLLGLVLTAAAAVTAAVQPAKSAPVKKAIFNQGHCIAGHGGGFSCTAASAGTCQTGGAHDTALSDPTVGSTGC